MNITERMDNNLSTKIIQFLALSPFYAFFLLLIFEIRKTVSQQVWIRPRMTLCLLEVSLKISVGLLLYSCVKTFINLGTVQKNVHVFKR